MANNIQIRDGNGQFKSMRTTEVRPDLHVPHQIVRSLARKFVDTFNGELMDLWDISSDLGGTATVTGGILTLGAGTTAGAYVEMLSKDTFTLPFRMMAGLMNTRNANNHCIMELVSVDPATGIPDGLNTAQVDIGGAASVTATQMKYSVQNGGLTPLESAVSTISTTAAYSILEIEPFEDEAWFHSRVIDAATGRSASYVRHQQLPDPNATYKVRLRSHNHGAWKLISNVEAGTGGAIRCTTAAAHGITNGATVWMDGLNNITNAGAKVRGNYVVTVISTTVFELNGTTFTGTFKANPGRCALAGVSTAVAFNMQFLNVQDYDELKAEIVGGRGNMVAGQGIGVNVVGTVPISGAVTMAAGSPNQDNINWTESGANLAANAVLTGVARDTGAAVAVAHRYSKFNVMALAPEAGNVRIEISTDNVTWRTVIKDTPTPADQALYLSIPVTTRYQRAVYTNGPAPQTAFLLTTSFTAA